MNRWIFEGLYRDGHREGSGEELYETKAAQTLVNFLDKNNSNSDSNGDSNGGGKEEEGHATKTGYAYDDDQGNVTTAVLQTLAPSVIQTNATPHFFATTNSTINSKQYIYHTINLPLHSTINAPTNSPNNVTHQRRKRNRGGRRRRHFCPPPPAVAVRGALGKDLHIATRHPFAKIGARPLFR